MKRLLYLLIFVFVGKFVFSQKFDFVVANDGTGDFIKVQDAINAVPDFRKNRTTIFIKKGIYKEKLTLPGSKTNVTFIGEDKDSTLLTFDDFASKKNRFGEEVGTTGSTSFYVFGEGFKAENITFENSSGPVGQAVAVRIDGDMVVFKNCRFLGFQDTLYPHGNESRQYYSNCYIEGTVDFIFGWSTAVFDHCTIFCKRNGYITAPSTDQGTAFGFVFLDCTVTGSATDASVYFGRPWRPYGKSVFFRCDLSNIIKPEGWNNWQNPENEKTAFFAEFKNTGAGADISNRVSWSVQLTDKQAEDYTPIKILGDWVNADLFSDSKENNKLK
jgi:pectinesterase